jgi:hypothetical protein
MVAPLPIKNVRGAKLSPSLLKMSTFIEYSAVKVNPATSPPEYTAVGAEPEIGPNVSSAQREPHRESLPSSTAAAYGTASRKGIFASLVSAGNQQAECQLITASSQNHQYLEDALHLRIVEIQQQADHQREAAMYIFIEFRFMTRLVLDYKHFHV